MNLSRIFTDGTSLVNFSFVVKFFENTSIGYLVGKDNENVKINEKLGLIFEKNEKKTSRFFSHLVRTF